MFTLLYTHVTSFQYYQYLSFVTSSICTLFSHIPSFYCPLTLSDAIFLACISLIGMVVSVAHGGSIEQSHLIHDHSMNKGESDDEFEDLFPPTPTQIVPDVLTDPMPSTMKKWDMATGKGKATKTRPYNYEDDELNFVTKPKRGE